jgi:hypothetical protein
MQTIKTGLKKTAKTVDMWRAQKMHIPWESHAVIIKMHWVPNGMKAELDMHAHFL